MHHEQLQTDIHFTNPDQEKIIGAIIRKAEQVCPDSLALIGIYGSVATGDTHEKSDLDLLILINDADGIKVSDAFLQQDCGIGYDIYCTSWDMLTEDARCPHPHLAKLFDSRIVYVKDPVACIRLDALKKQASAILASEERYACADKLLRQAKEMYADCCLADSLSAARIAAGCCIQLLLDAVMLYHGAYFRRGTKRTFEELEQLHLPFSLEEPVTAVICAASVMDIQSHLTLLLRLVNNHLQHPKEKMTPTPENLRGTYEEMYSNWKNKMTEAAHRGDVFSSFMNLLSLQMMLGELETEFALEPIDVMQQFDPDNLSGNAVCFDRALQKYRSVYEKIGLPVREFADMDTFIHAYLHSDPRST
ncbi:MAG: nucleotidyltransferase domain-containing protein [Clostridia bacterium]|nr:nucleotidyltransferase domain-containing protein [Clostridia bacterium]